MASSMKMNKRENWAEFCRRIIETNGNPSTKDAEECNISFSKWFELAARYSNDSKRMVAAARNVLSKMGG